MNINSYEEAIEYLSVNSFTWLVTGAAGFIGSNLIEKLLILNQRVIGIDNLSTGHLSNIEDVKNSFDKSTLDRNFTFLESDVTDISACQAACSGIDYVLHQAALGSVPRSVLDPISTHNANINGHLNMLVASRDNAVKRFVYASSSSIYGDHPDLPKVESKTGNPLSPYAVTKSVNEIYSKNFSTTYGLDTIGLRYFNIFGKRQDPEGAYAAVIPKWVSLMINNEKIQINGDGKTTRDFCYIENVIQANILSAVTSNNDAVNKVYNIANNDNTSLLDLYQMISANLKRKIQKLEIQSPEYRDFQDGDVRHSQGSIQKAEKYLGYKPTHNINQGLHEAIDWYIANS
jgi:UDP-N-acetylglucosamine 4-epimerase